MRTQPKNDDHGRWEEWAEIELNDATPIDALPLAIRAELQKVTDERREWGEDYEPFDKAIPVTPMVSTAYITIWGYRPYTDEELERRRKAKIASEKAQRARAEKQRVKDLATLEKLAEKVGVKVIGGK